MKARININTELYLDQIIIDKHRLSDILQFIHTKTSECVQTISIERQSDNPDLTYIDVALYEVLNFIEELK